MSLVHIKTLLQASLFLMKVMYKISKFCNIKTSLQVLLKAYTTNLIACDVKGVSEEITHLNSSLY
jgi:hypothetical protein